MKKIKYPGRYVIIFFIISQLSSCFKEGVDNQIRLQEILLSPQKLNKCWVLSNMRENETIDYNLQWNAHYAKKRFLPEYESYHNEQKYKIPLTGNFTDTYSSDDNLHDCEYNVRTKDSVFFNTANYPDLGADITGYYDAPTSLNYSEYENKGGSNTSTLKRQFYYYEEFYFEENGLFRKKIFKDVSCNFITITGSWKFLTPFATVNGNNPESQIVLSYANKNIIGVEHFSDIYTIKAAAFRDDFMSFYQRSESTDFTFEKIRSHYSVFGSDVTRTEGFRNGDTLINGNVINHAKGVCRSGKDKLDIYPLTFSRFKSCRSEWYYSQATPRCSNGTGPGVNTGTFTIGANVYVVQNITRSGTQIKVDSYRNGTDSGTILFSFSNLANLPAQGSPPQEYKVVPFSSIIPPVPLDANEIRVSATSFNGSNGIGYACIGTDNVKAIVTVSSSGKISFKMPVATAAKLVTGETVQVSANINE